MLKKFLNVKEKANYPNKNKNNKKKIELFLAIWWKAKIDTIDFILRIY